MKLYFDHRDNLLGELNSRHRALIQLIPLEMLKSPVFFNGEIPARLLALMDQIYITSLDESTSIREPIDKALAKGFPDLMHVDKPHSKEELNHQQVLCFFIALYYCHPAISNDLLLEYAMQLHLLDKTKLQIGALLGKESFLNGVPKDSVLTTLDYAEAYLLATSYDHLVVMDVLRRKHPPLVAMQETYANDLKSLFVFLTQSVPVGSSTPSSELHLPLMHYFISLAPSDACQRVAHNDYEALYFLAKEHHSEVLFYFLSLPAVFIFADRGHAQTALPNPFTAYVDCFIEKTIEDLKKQEDFHFNYIDDDTLELYFAFLHNLIRINNPERNEFIAVLLAIPAVAKKLKTDKKQFTVLERLCFEDTCDFSQQTNAPKKVRNGYAKALLDSLRYNDVERLVAPRDGAFFDAAKNTGTNRGVIASQGTFYSGHT